jgi:hypothetical protein
MTGPPDGPERIAALPPARSRDRANLLQELALAVGTLDRCFEVSEAGFERGQDAPECCPAGVAQAALDAAESGRREFGVVREILLGGAGLFA